MNDPCLFRFAGFRLVLIGVEHGNLFFLLTPAPDFFNVPVWLGQGWEITTGGCRGRQRDLTFVIFVISGMLSQPSKLEVV